MSDLEIPIEFRIDGLTTMMLSMVTFVSTLVAIFAAGYMAGDPGYPRFFALIGLFVFSMTGLVLSNNYVLTYVFWEGVGRLQLSADRVTGTLGPRRPRPR